MPFISLPRHAGDDSFGYGWSASTSGNTPFAPARRSSRAATARVHPLSARSSTRNTGPDASDRLAARACGTVKAWWSPRTRWALFEDGSPNSGA